MSTLKISEAGSVQFPMVDHAAEIGWEPLTPVEALFRRGDESASLFRGQLEQKLLAFNSWLKTEQARSIVETFDALPATIDGNRERLAWLRGKRQWYDETEKRHRRVQLIDFEHVAIDRKIDLHRKKRAVLEELFKALLHKLMTGERRVGDLDLSALKPQRMAAAAP